jgi:hypothetical protein
MHDTHTHTDPDDDIYDLAPEPPPRPVLPAPPPNTLDYRIPEEERRAIRATAADGETIKNLYMPLWLLAGGLAIEIANAFFLRLGWFVQSRRLETAASAVTLEVLARTAILLVGIFVAARLRRLHLGTFWTALLKLAAIAVAPSAVLSLIWPVLWLIPFFGGLVGWAIYFCLYFALIGALFDLDEEDTWYCVIVTFFISLVLHFLFPALSRYAG